MEVARLDSQASLRSVRSLELAASVEKPPKHVVSWLKCDKRELRELPVIEVMIDSQSHAPVEPVNIDC